MNEQLFLILTSSAFAIGIWWLYFVEYRNYRTDLARQRLFEIRDNLFEEAKKGTIPFDSKAYGMTRITLNGMIQFMHNMSFIRIMFTLLTYKIVKEKEHVDKYHNDMQGAILALPKPARKIILETQLDMHFIVFAHIIRSSIILMLLSESIRIILKIFHQWKQVRNHIASGRTKKQWNIVDAEANEIGNDCIFTG